MPSSLVSEAVDAAAPALSTSLLARLDAGVLTLTLNRPDRSNAIDGPTWALLLERLRGVADDPEIRVVVLSSVGKNFCAGADLAQESTGAAAERSHLRFMQMVADVIRSLHHLRVPTIACVSGAAFGAGWNLALACDVVLASDGARFCQVFSRRGLAVDSGGSWLLPRLVGLQRAKEIVLTAREIHADEALDLGLVTRVVPLDDLEDTVAGVAAQLAAGAPIALGLSKAMLNESFAASLDQALESEARAQSVVLASEDGAEALRAFVEKRPPRFTGR
jgi:enoyl-CoA hydratase/carnithine racemase